MSVIKNPTVADKFAQYPPNVRKKMLALRKLVLQTAKELQLLEQLEESLKWNEPSYHVKGGSPLRMDWKPKTPEQYALYFVCTTKLVDTFRELYGDRLIFEGNRAIVFSMTDELPVATVKKCLTMAFRYQRLKSLPLLGA